MSKLTSQVEQPIKSPEDDDDQPIKFDIMVAICDGNRGFGYKNGLPWPSLQ